MPDQRPQIELPWNRSERRRSHDVSASASIQGSRCNATGVGSRAAAIPIPVSHHGGTKGDARLRGQGFPLGRDRGEADFDALKAHGFDEEDIWDVAGISALFGLSNRMANVTAMLPNAEFYTIGRS
jgi:hypothetical protein